ncbi:hypothetical protein [Pseudochrobactrum sp. MP213Fo]
MGWILLSGCKRHRVEVSFKIFEDWMVLVSVAPKTTWWRPVRIQH